MDCDYGFIFGWVPRGKSERGRESSKTRCGTEGRRLAEREPRASAHPRPCTGSTFRAFLLRPFQTSTTRPSGFTHLRQAGAISHLQIGATQGRSSDRNLDAPPLASRARWRGKSRPTLGALDSLFSRVPTTSTRFDHATKAHKIWHHSQSGHDGPTTLMRRKERTTTTCQALR